MKPSKRPVAINSDSMLITQVFQRIAVYAWDLSARLQPHVVIGYFYIFSSILFVYLEQTLPPQTAFGLRTIETAWGIHTEVTIAIYAIFGVAVSQPNRKPIIYLFLLLPSMFYSLVLAQISMSGIPLAWTAFIYTSSFVGLAIVSIHQRWQITQINKTTLAEAGMVLALENEVKEIQKRRSRNDEIYLTLYTFFSETTENGQKSLSQDGVHLMLSYMKIFSDQNTEGLSVATTTTTNANSS